MLVQPSAFVLEHAPWSSSKSDTAEQCPYKFYRQYIKKDKTPTNVDALLGQVIHAALEYVLYGMAPKPAVNKALEKYALTSNEIDKVYDFVPNIANFKHKFTAYQKKHSGLQPKVEQKLAVTLEGKPVKFFAKEGIFFRGALDLSMLFSARAIGLILDHKTGKQRELVHYKRQFDAYRWLLKATCPELEGALSAIHFVAEDTIDFFPGIFPLKDPIELRNTVVTNLNKATANSSDFTRTNKGPLCAWCGYKELGCPAHTDSTWQQTNQNKQ
jgi:hypothetical protein